MIAAAPVTDTIKRPRAATRARSCVEPTVPARERDDLWAAQTPQAFRAEALREALRRPEALAAATDDAMLVEASGGEVLIHASLAENLR